MDDHSTDDVGDNGSNGRLVRPYLMTGGRTAPVEEIALESLLQTTLHGRDVAPQRWESAQILDLTARPIALVEIAARLSIPIGVARVLVSDLIAMKAISVQRPVASMSTKSHTSLLERVLDGVRNL